MTIQHFLNNFNGADTKHWPYRFYVGTNHLGFEVRVLQEYTLAICKCRGYGREPMQDWQIVNVFEFFSICEKCQNELDLYKDQIIKNTLQ